MRKFRVYPKYMDSSEVPPEIKRTAIYGARSLVTEEAGQKDSLGDKDGWWQEFRNHRAVNEKLWGHSLLRQQREYNNGALSSVIYFRKKGITTIEVNYTGAPTRAITTDPNNVIHGAYQEWDTQGNTFLEAGFRDGVLHGVAKIYWPSGKLRASCRFIRGERFGHERSFYENGNLKTSVEYRNGRRRGWCYHWDPEGLHLASFLWARNSYAEDSRGSRDNIAKLSVEITKSFFDPLLGHLRLSKHREAQMKFRPQNNISTFYERLKVATSMSRPLNEIPACV